MLAFSVGPFTLVVLLALSFVLGIVVHACYVADGLKGVWDGVAGIFTFTIMLLFLAAMVAGALYYASQHGWAMLIGQALGIVLFIGAFVGVAFLAEWALNRRRRRDQ